MEDGLIKSETAKLAKEKGFDTAIEKIYDETGVITTGISGTGKLVKNSEWGDRGCYSAPTQPLLQKWLREAHNIDVVIAPERYKDGVNYIVQAQKWDLGSDEEFNPNFTVDGSYWFNDNGEYPTYEVALEKGLEEGLKLINTTAREEH